MRLAGDVDGNGETLLRPAKILSNKRQAREWTDGFGETQKQTQKQNVAESPAQGEGGGSSDQRKNAAA